MNGLEDKLLRLGQAKIDDYRREADRERLVSAYLRATAPCRTWRWRSAEALLALAARLSPYHRALVRGARRAGQG